MDSEFCASLCSSLRTREVEYVATGDMQADVIYHYLLGGNVKDSLPVWRDGLLHVLICMTCFSLFTENTNAVGGFGGM
jgi:hypothetical protein